MISCIIKFLELFIFINIFFLLWCFFNFYGYFDKLYGDIDGISDKDLNKIWLFSKDCLLGEDLWENGKRDKRKLVERIGKIVEVKKI